MVTYSVVSALISGRAEKVDMVRNGVERFVRDPLAAGDGDGRPNTSPAMSSLLLLLDVEC